MMDALRKFFFHDFWLKLFSLALAVLIWLTVSTAIHRDISPAAPFAGASTETSDVYDGIPVLVVSADGDVRGVQVNPGKVDVRVRGNAQAFQGLRAGEIRAWVNLTGVQPAAGQRVKVQVTVPAGIGITVDKVTPDSVEITTPTQS